MPHGQPDFGMYAPKETIASLADMAELAVRLGSIITYDRRGDVVWFDSFENGTLVWSTTIDGTTGSIAIETANPHHGAFCCRLTTSHDDIFRTRIYKRFPITIRGGLGLECSLTINPNCDSFDLRFTRHDGVNYHVGGLHHDQLHNKLQYYDYEDRLQDLATGIQLYSASYHTIKMVVDLKNDKYVRALLDNESYDMSTLAVYRIDSPIEPYLSVQLTYIGKSGLLLANYLDDIIITQNEPV